MEFNQTHLVKGGKVFVPHSMVNSDTYGEIVESTANGIHVVYFKDTPNEQKAFYSFNYLKVKYGQPTIKLLPPSTQPSRFDDEFTPDDPKDLPWE